jgi:hypothetical protein
MITVDLASDEAVALPDSKRPIKLNGGATSG